MTSESSSPTQAPPPTHVEGSPRLDEILVLPPEHEDDVCARCRGVRLQPEDQFCENCRDADEQLTRTCPLIVPITLYIKPSPLRDVLTGYKDVTRSADDRAQDSYLLREIYTSFVAASGDQLLQAVEPDMTCIVPSTTRQPPHPLGEIVSAAAGLLGQPTELLRRGPGQLDHRVMSEDAYEVTQPLNGRRVLLLDDVITTGSRIHCAAAALARGGGVVVGALVLARRYNVTYHPTVQAVWQRQQAVPFTFRQTWPAPATE